MIVLTVSDCPPKVRGDLSKWLFEINTGVYVGRVSSRVRDELWERVCENLRHGQATLVYPDSGEQKIAFRVHNTSWEIADFDGLKLMRRPSATKRSLSGNNSAPIKEGFSRAAQKSIAHKVQSTRYKAAPSESYTIIDIETTGLSLHKDQIIEIAALKIVNNVVTQKMTALINIAEPLPYEIVKLTGITDEILSKEGQPSKDALKTFLKFIDNDLLVCHNAQFDIGFIQLACRNLNLAPPRNRCIDTLILARQKLRQLANYQLTTIAKYFSLDAPDNHRALNDCYLTYGIYTKLKEI